MLHRVAVYSFIYFWIGLPQQSLSSLRHETIKTRYLHTTHSNNRDNSQLYKIMIMNIKKQMNDQDAHVIIDKSNNKFLTYVYLHF